MKRAMLLMALPALVMYAPARASIGSGTRLTSDGTFGVAVQRIPLGGNCTGVAWNGSYIYVLEHGAYEDATLMKLDPVTGVVVESSTIHANNLMGLTWDGDHFWAVSHNKDALANPAGSSSNLYEFDASGNVIRQFATPGPLRWESTEKGLAWDGTDLWLVDVDRNTNAYKIFKIDPTDGSYRVDEAIPLDGIAYPEGLTFDGEYLWLSDQYSPETPGGGNLYKIHPRTKAIVAKIPVQGLNTEWPGEGDLAFDGRYIWQTRNTDGVYKIDVGVIPTAAVVRSYFGAWGNNTGVAWKDGYLYGVEHGAYYDATLMKIDPVSGAVVESTALHANNLMGLAWDGTNFWAVSHNKDPNASPQGNSHNLYEFDSAGNVIQAFATPGPEQWESTEKGLTWDGSSLWLVDVDAATNAYKLFKIDPVTGSYSVDEAIPLNGVVYPEGVTWDGEYLWLSDQYSPVTPGGGHLYMIDPTVKAIVATIPVHGLNAGWPGEGDLAFDGRYIWQSRNTDGFYKIEVK